MVEGKKSPNWNKNDSSPILKIMALPIAIVIIALGIMTILGGHITPGGGFQGGAMIASGIILSVLVYVIIFNGSSLYNLLYSCFRYL